MPRLKPLSCPRHEVDEDDERWQQALMIVSDQVNHNDSKTFTPCPWCLDQILHDMKKTHEMLDTVNIPRRSRGKSDLPLRERLAMLFECSTPLSELRTS